MSDLVASLVGRFYPAPPTDVDKADVLKLFAAVRNNVPALLQEMHLTEAEEKVRRGGRSIPSGAGALRADGPILTSYMQTFGAKLGLALHFELHQKSVPISGGVLPFWFSKAANGEIPPRLLETLPAPLTMTQGKEHVADQFQYSWATTEQRDHTLLFAVFRQSFAVAAFTDNDRTWLEGRLAAYENIGGNLRIFAPGEVQDPPVNRL